MVEFQTNLEKLWGMGAISDFCYVCMQYQKQLIFFRLTLFK